ncbi:MAG: hypothetical protein JNM17_02575, partial [Archangium sp.]|nr:hypothetical protein [Archangium sp.]
TECDVCGKALGGLDGLGAPPVAVQQIEGLEQTLAEKIGDVPVQAMGELEVSRYAKVEVAPDVTPDLVTTAGPRVGEVAVERVADLSVDRVPDDGSRTPLPQGPITCRYCRNVQAAGSLCERCGMKLPVVIVAADLIVGAVIGSIEEVKTRCKSCGAPATAGKKCGDCGRDVPFPDA